MARQKGIIKLEGSIGEILKSVVNFSDQYQVLPTYDSNTGKFISTNDGIWKLVGITVTEKAKVIQRL